MKNVKKVLFVTFGLSLVLLFSAYDGGTAHAQNMSCDQAVDGGGYGGC